MTKQTPLSPIDQFFADHPEIAVANAESAKSAKSMPATRLTTAKLLHERDALRADRAKLIEALNAIASVLEAPRDRLGRLDIAATQGEAREALRLLAVRYDATGSHDYMCQCANVARALLRELGEQS